MRQNQSHWRSYQEDPGAFAARSLRAEIGPVVASLAEDVAPKLVTLMIGTEAITEEELEKVRRGDRTVPKGDLSMFLGNVLSAYGNVENERTRLITALLKGPSKGSERNGPDKGSSNNDTSADKAEPVEPGITDPAKNPKLAPLFAYGNKAGLKGPFGKRVLALARANRVSNASLIEAVDGRQKFISNLAEKGSGTVVPEDVRQIVKALGVLMSAFDDLEPVAETATPSVPSKPDVVADTAGESSGELDPNLLIFGYGKPDEKIRLMANVKRATKEKGVSIVALAEAAGVESNLLHVLAKTGRGKVTMKFVTSIAKKLGVAPAELTEGLKIGLETAEDATASGPKPAGKAKPQKKAPGKPPPENSKRNGGGKEIVPHGGTGKDLVAAALGDLTPESEEWEEFVDMFLEFVESGGHDSNPILRRLLLGEKVNLPREVLAMSACISSVGDALAELAEAEPVAFRVVSSLSAEQLLKVAGGKES